MSLPWAGTAPRQWVRGKSACPREQEIWGAGGNQEREASRPQAIIPVQGVAWGDHERVVWGGLLELLLFPARSELVKSPFHAEPIQQRSTLASCRAISHGPEMASFPSCAPQRCISL